MVRDATAECTVQMREELSNKVVYGGEEETHC